MSIFVYPTVYAENSMECHIRLAYQTFQENIIQEKPPLYVGYRIWLQIVQFWNPAHSILSQKFRFLVYSLLSYCYDLKTTTTKRIHAQSQLMEEWVYCDLWLQRDKSPSWLEGIEVRGRYRGRSRKLHPQTGSRETQLEPGWSNELLNPKTHWHTFSSN